MRLKCSETVDAAEIEPAVHGLVQCTYIKLVFLLAIVLIIILE